MSKGDPGHFLQRWSRLKERAREEARQVLPAEPPERDDPSGHADPPGQAGAATADASAPSAEVPLPDIDALDGDSDYSAFLTPGVDALLRRRALRKLFHSPKFNVLDGLDDYMGDFRTFEPLGDLVTADMRQQIERAAQRVAKALEEPREAVPVAAAPATEDSPHQEPPPDAGPAEPA